MRARFAANLSMMFTEVPFLERFQAAAQAGFTAVEYLFPYEYPAEELAAALRANGLTQALFNAPPGDWENGERGIAALASREEEFRSGVDLALEYAGVLECRNLHIMAGNAARSGDSAELYARNLAYAADEAAKVGVTITIEPINSRDMPEYYLDDFGLAHRVLQDVDRVNLGLQFDFYHAQIIHGDVTTLMRRHIRDIRHVQIASVPDRHEPDSGEINYPYVLAELEQAGYNGWIGCEYHPAGDTTAGLGWLQTYDH